MQFRGVAPAADIIGVKVLDATGQGASSAVMAGMLWAVAHKDQLRHRRAQPLDRAATRSRPTDYDPIATAVEFAWKNGITVVCAAGNEGEFGPGRHPLPGQQPLRHHRRRHRHAADARAR